MRWLFSKLVFSSFESFTSLEVWPMLHTKSVLKHVPTFVLCYARRFTGSFQPKVPVEVLCSSSLFGVNNCFFILSVNALVGCVSIVRHPMRLTASSIGGEPRAILLHGSRLSDRNMLGNIGKKVILVLFLVAFRQISKIQTF